MTTERKLSKQQSAKLTRARSKLDPGHRPLLIRDENGERVVDGDSFPAHLRRFYGVSTLGRIDENNRHVRSARQRPHRNTQGGILKGGQRGNGAAHNGRFSGHGAGKKLTEGW